MGHTVGIKMFARGVLVVDLAEGKSPAKECGLAKGDVILQCNGTAVTSTEQFQQLLQGEEEVELAVRRGGSAKTLTAEPEQNEDGAWVIGAWIRDSMAGIGTVTYYDPATGAFGALGHGVTDTDTAPAAALRQRQRPALHGEGREAGPGRGRRGAKGKI